MIESKEIHSLSACGVNNSYVAEVVYYGKAYYQNSSVQQGWYGMGWRADVKKYIGWPC